MSEFSSAYGDYKGNRNNIKFFMRYVMSRYEKNQKDLAYRFYVTDGIFAQGNNSHLTKRFTDLLSESQGYAEDDGDTIASDIIGRLGLHFGTEESE